MAEEIKNPAAEAGEVNIGDILRVRREKLAALREAGNDPFRITNRCVATLVALSPLART